MNRYFSVDLKFGVPILLALSLWVHPCPLVILAGGLLWLNKALHRKDSETLLCSQVLMS